MRTDEELGKSFRSSQGWKTDAFSGEKAPELDHRVQDGGRVENGKFLTHSHSGHERNHLFLSNAGAEFMDISTVSGLDSIADSRGFVLWDFDRDGWQDIALVNANAPLLNVFRNQIGSLQQSGDCTRKMFAVRLVGGNVSAKTSTTYGPRDGYGAKINVSLADLTIQREHRCGDGFAVQNSNTIIVGIGDRDYVDSVQVVWPSGRTQTTGQLAAGTLLTVFENPSDAPDTDGFAVQPYLVDRPPTLARHSEPTANSQTMVLSGAQSDSHGSSDPSRFKMYTTMATWCEACKRLQPQLEHLRSFFPRNELEMYGVPVDTSDTHDKLRTYMATFQPPYELVWDLTEQDRAKVENVIGRAIKGTALPSTVITDDGGKVLSTFAGVPTASDVAKLRLGRN